MTVILITRITLLLSMVTLITVLKNAPLLRLKELTDFQLSGNTRAVIAKSRSHLGLCKTQMMCSYKALLKTNPWKYQ